MKKVLFLICLLASGSLATLAQEQIKVQGRVIDASTKEPVIGASVYVENTAVGEVTNVAGQIKQSALGTVTDINGNYSFSIPANIPYYSIAYIGYDKIRVQTSADFKTINLEMNQQLLGEVIVTGYTDIKKRNNTTAYDKVKVEEIRQVGVSGVDQLLEGQIAGVQLSNFNGGPNSAPQIRIRGTVSINGTQDPLWVLDGLPLEGTTLPNTFDKDNLNSLQNLPIAGINPDDIESITVLKDAAATSIYGARAANGVIVITTKKGKSGPAKVQFSANTFVSQRPDFSKLNLMNASEKVDFELGLAGRTDLSYRTGNGAIARLFSQSGELGAFQIDGLSALSAATLASVNGLRQGQTNWGDELFRNALNQQYTASISGGTDQHNYYISGGVYDEKATTKGVDMRRYSLTFNNNFKLSDKFKGGLSLLGSTTKRNNFIQDTDGFTNPNYYMRSVNPYLSVRNADGSFNYDPDIQGYENDTYVPFNAIEERENTDYSLSNKSLKAIANLSYQIIPSLAIRTELGLQFDETGVERFADQNSYYTRKYRLRSRYFSGGEPTFFLPLGGIIENQETSAFQYNWKSFLEFNKIVNDVHELNLMAGTELRKSDNSIISTKGFGFNPNTLTTQTVIFPNANYNNNAAFKQYQKTIGETAYASFYANAGYTYDRRYNVYGSIRYDGSNMFGVDPKYRFLPIWSISGAWNVTEEDFMDNQSVFNDIKVRASYGTQGNIDRNTYPFVIGVYGNSTLLPGGNETTVGVTSPPNDKLRWEKTQAINAGIDVSAFSNKVQFTFDYYSRKSTDLIGLSALPLENGFDYVQRNWASVKNEGVELSISTRNISRSNFSWSTDFNIAHNKNRLLRVETNPTAYSPDNREGYPINSLFVLETAGLDADGVPQFYGDNGEIVPFEDFYELYDPWADFFPGFILNTNLDNASYRDKFKYKGSLDPQFLGGITNRFRYRNIDLTVSALFHINQWMRKTPSYNPAMVDPGFNYSRDILAAGQNLPAIGGTSIDSNPRWMAYNWMTTTDPANSYRYLDIWTKKMSYMRINSIRLGYTFPQATLKKIKMSNLRVNLEGRNLFVLSNGYEGFYDPETYGNFYAQPLAKSFALGLSASF